MTSGFGGITGGRGGRATNPTLATELLQSGGGGFPPLGLPRPWRSPRSRGAGGVRREAVGARGRPEGKPDLPPKGLCVVVFLVGGHTGHQAPSLAVLWPQPGDGATHPPQTPRGFYAPTNPVPAALNPTPKPQTPKSLSRQERRRMGNWICTKVSIPCPHPSHARNVVWDLALSVN